MNLEKFFLSEQDGGPPEKEVQAYMKEKNISTLEELVKYVRKKQKQNKQARWSDRVSRGQVPSKRKQAEEAQLKAYGQPRRKAKGGYVKKYAKGGGVRKVRT